MGKGEGGQELEGGWEGKVCLSQCRKPDSPLYHLWWSISQSGVHIPECPVLLCFWSLSLCTGLEVLSNHLSCQLFCFVSF